MLEFPKQILNRETNMIINSNNSHLSLSDLFKSIEDPRKSQGQLYPFSFLLNCAQAAILAGAKGFRQIGEWIDAQSYEKLKEMGNLYRRKPDESTLRKCFKKIKINTFKELCYKWSADKALQDGHNTDAIAVDGKTLRGARNTDYKQPHLLSAVSHGSGFVLGDHLVPSKKSEVQHIQPFLDNLDIKGKIITADALHTIRDFGVYLTKRGADYVFIAKGNKYKLIERLKMLEIRNNYTSVYETKDKIHGRLETRRVYLLSELPWWVWFKSAEQAFIIERKRKYIKTGKIEEESHFGLTSILKEKADAKKILEIVRGHWTVENKAFHVRDRTMSEDQSTVRANILPELMVVFRNLALNVFRFNKEKNIAKAMRRCALFPGEELDLLGIS